MSPKKARLSLVVLLGLPFCEPLNGSPQVSQWETEIAKQPDNIALRSNLIREYFRLSRQDPGAEKARVGHILWLVAHRPEIPFLAEPAATVGRQGDEYATLEKAWLAQVNKADVTAPVLVNAANFFRPLAPAHSIELLKRARALEPGNPIWTMMLGEMYAFQIVGVPALNQNGLPVSVDGSKVDSGLAEKTKGMLLASGDSELLAAVVAGLQGRAGIVASMTKRRGEMDAFAEELLKRMLTAEPQNPKWHTGLAQFYAHQAESATSQHAALMRKAMKEFDAAAALDPAIASALPPSRYARIAVETGELDKAQLSAERCLAKSVSPGFRDTAIHECNLILGRVALRRGDLKRAGDYLLAASKVDGKGSLSSFGPNMMLASELLAKGQRDIVLEYFRLCGNFWSYDRGQLARWTEQVKSGETPQFGANLVY